MLEAGLPRAESAQTARHRRGEATWGNKRGCSTKSFTCLTLHKDVLHSLGMSLNLFWHRKALPDLTQCISIAHLLPLPEGHVVL